MGHLTADSIITIIKGGTYPYSFQYYHREPRFPIYPYISVYKVTQDSLTSTTTIKSDDEVFNIVVAIKYNLVEGNESVDIESVENSVLGTLESASLNVGKYYFQRKDWRRQEIDKPMGIQTTLTLVVRDIESRTGVGILGSDITLSISGGSTITVLSFRSDQGPRLQTHSIDSGTQFADPVSFITNDIYIEFENTNALETEILGYISAGVEKSVTLTKKGVPVTYNLLFGDLSKSGQFDNIERAVLHGYAN